MYPSIVKGRQRQVAALLVKNYIQICSVLARCQRRPVVVYYNTKMSRSSYFSSAGQTQRELKARSSKGFISLAVLACVISLAIHLLSQFWIPSPLRAAFAAPFLPTPTPSEAVPTGGNIPQSKEPRVDRQRPFLLEDVTIVTPGESPTYAHHQSILIQNGAIQRIFDASNYTDLALVQNNTLSSK